MFNVSLVHSFASAFSYSTSTTTSSKGWTAALIFLLIGIFVFTVIAVAGLWRVFTKAGHPGWAAIIPIYNSWVLLEMGGQKGWISLVALLSFIPIVGIIAAIVYVVFFIMAALEIARRFGKSALFAIFGLVIFSIIGYLILGFGDAKYTEPAEEHVGGNQPPYPPVGGGTPPPPQPPQPPQTSQPPVPPQVPPAA